MFGDGNGNPVHTGALCTLLVCLASLALTDCGTTAGGGGGGGAPPGATTAAAVGAVCHPSVHQEACLAGGNHRVRCDAASVTWQLIELCAAGTVCIATVVDPATGRSTTACGVPAPDTMTQADTSNPDAGGIVEAGTVEAGTVEAGTTADAPGPDTGGLAPIPAPDVPQPQVEAVKPIEITCPMPDKEIELLAGGVDTTYGVQGQGAGLVLHGPFQWQDFSKSVTRKGCMSNNKLVGKLETWYGSGQKASIGHRDAQGRQHGPLLAWHANGAKAYETMAKLGLIVGWSQGHSDSGVPTWETYLDSDGKLHGKAVRWYDKGSPRSTGWYLHGKVQGPFTSWHESGPKSYEGAYDKGMQEGLHRYFTKKGAPAGEAVFSKGNGQVTALRDDGSKNWQRSWKDGKWHGKWLRWYASGEILNEATYDMGTGVAIVREKNGDKVFETHYVDGQKDGAFKRWNTQGKLIEEGTHHKGSRVDTWRFFKASGDLDYALCYYGGTSVIVAECPKSMSQPWPDTDTP